MEKACGNVDPVRLRALDAKCAAGYTPGDKASEARFMAANHDFHMEIARCCGNSRLATALSQIIDEMTRLLHLGFVMRERPEEMRSEHSALIEALEKSEKALARHMTVTHIETIRKLVIEGIMSHTNLSITNIAPT
jgi:DNA-binding GntR family transcriptional regulator